MNYSRRKYGESVRYLKSAIAHDGLSHAFRRRCVELLLAIYGTEIPEAGDSHLTKKSVKELIQTRSVDKAIRQGVSESVAAARSAKDERQAEIEEQEREDKVSAMLTEFLKVKPTETESAKTGKKAEDQPKEVQTVRAPTQKEERERQRWLHALAVVADGSLSQERRLAAVVRVQSGMPENSSLRHLKAPALLKRVLPPWSEREYLEGGRVVIKRISSPPISLDDVWR